MNCEVPTRNKKLGIRNQTLNCEVPTRNKKLDIRNQTLFSLESLSHKKVSGSARRWPGFLTYGVGVYLEPFLIDLFDLAKSSTMSAKYSRR